MEKSDTEERGQFVCFINAGEKGRVLSEDNDSKD